MDDTSLQHSMEVWGAAKGLADQGSGPTHQKGDQRVCADHTGITVLTLWGKFPPRCWKGCRLLNLIKEEKGRFCPGCARMDQLLTLARILEGGWEYPHPVCMCFVDLE